MAAMGNEAVKLSQLKELYKVASDTSYGVVRLVSDEDLMSLVGGSSVEVGSFELKDSNLIADFNISCGLSSNGTITIDGSFGTTQTVDGPATLFTIPEGYRPTSTTSAQIRRQGGSYDTMTLRVGTDGVIGLTSVQSLALFYTWEIEMSYVIDMPEQVELPSATVITVQQLKMLMNSGGSSGDSPSGSVETVIFDNILADSTETFDATPYDSLRITIQRNYNSTQYIETVSPPYSAGQYSSPQGYAVVQETAEPGHIYIVTINYNYRIVKVVGVKNG